MFSSSKFSQPPVSTFCLGSKIIISALIYRLPLIWQAQFHTNTKQRTKLLFCIFERFSSPYHPDLRWGPPSLLFSGHEASLLVVKWPKCDADHSLPSSTEVKNEWRCTSTPEYLHSMYRDNFTFVHLNLYIFAYQMGRQKILN
jgi:hypothetical protein